jgi:uncharacterized protein
MPESSPLVEPITCPVRIGVIADTHLNLPNRWLRPEVLSALDDCDFIFHAGDINHAWVLERLREIAPVRAVVGNNDDADLQATLPVMRLFQAGIHRIGLIHGHTPTSHKRQTAVSVTLEQLRGRVDCAIYGHSHKPDDSVRDGLRMVNPGSATWPRWEPAPSYAIVEIAETIDVRLIRF